MKAIALQNRIEKSNNKKGTAPKNNDYESALQILVSNGKHIHINYTTGSGRYTKVAGKNPAKYLTQWGVEFEYGNDAPRGGKLGEYIKLTNKGKRQCKDYYKNHLQNLENQKKQNEIFEAKQKAKKDQEEKEIKEIVSLIDKIDGEDLNVTAGRLKNALNGKILDKNIFWTAVRMVRKK